MDSFFYMTASEMINKTVQKDQEWDGADGVGGVALFVFATRPLS